MNRKVMVVGACLTVALVGAVGWAAHGFPATHHAYEVSKLGQPVRGQTLESVIDQPGPVSVESVIGCDWVVPRSGVLNLDHPTARAAGLKDGDEPIVIAFYVLRHPEHGTFLVDTGVERAMRDEPEHSLAKGIVGKVMHLEKMRFKSVTGEWLSQHSLVPKGVFLTHLHLDHVTGMRDVPIQTPVYLGPGEAGHRALLNWFTVSITDTALENKPPLREWQFSPDPDGLFAGIIDVFGDRTVFALRVPGHTAGSVAYLARTERGPVLMTGDASHTAWGWTHDVEPGTFSEDKPLSADSFARLKRFAERHSTLDVRLGHQILAPTGT